MKKTLLLSVMVIALFLISCTPEPEVDKDTQQIEEELNKLSGQELDEIIAEGSDKALAGQAVRTAISKSPGPLGKFYMTISAEKRTIASDWTVREVLESAKKVKEFKGLCGNGKLDSFGKIVEECDDSNKKDEDGCSSQCLIEDKWGCYGEPSSCMKCIDVPGIIGWWPGDKDGTDLKEKNHGVIEKGTELKEGKVGNAFAFSAEGAGVEVNAGEPAISDFDFRGDEDDFTIEAWVKTSKGGVIVSKLGKLSVDAPEYYTGFELSVAPSGKVNVLLVTLGGSSVEQKLEAGTSGIKVNDGQWHHMMMVFKAKKIAAGYCPTVGYENLKIYIDGILRGGKPEGYACIDMRNDAPLRLGSHTGLESSDDFSGLVDEVTIYGRALSESEVKSLHQVGSAGKCK